MAWQRSVCEPPVGTVHADVTTPLVWASLSEIRRTSAANAGDGRQWAWPLDIVLEGGYDETTIRLAGHHTDVGMGVARDHDLILAAAATIAPDPEVVRLHILGANQAGRSSSRHENDPNTDAPTGYVVCTHDRAVSHSFHHLLE